MKRILVTGGAGFIGSHLCVRLLNEGCQVVCLDNFLTGSPKNIQHLTANPNFQMAEQDIRPLIVRTGPIDEIYNLACSGFAYTLPVQSDQDTENERTRRDQHAGSGH